MDKEEIKQESHSKLIITLVALMILVTTAIGASVAVFTYTKQSDKINTISTGNISLEYKEDTNGISITDAYPMSDATGKLLSGEGQYFDFTVKAIIEGNATTIYEIAAEKLVTSTLDNKEVKLYLEKQEGNEYKQLMKPTVFTPLKEKTTSNTPKGAMLLAKEKVSVTKDTAYRLRMWVDENTQLESVSKFFSVQIAVNATLEV